MVVLVGGRVLCLLHCSASTAGHLTHPSPPARFPAAGIQASAKDGVLTISVPKTEEAKPKSIDISVE